MGIYLHEGLVDRAAEVIDQDQHTWYGTVEQVADAAMQSHPDWVIRQCKAQAEPIINQGKYRHYLESKKGRSLSLERPLGSDR